MVSFLIYFGHFLLSYKLCVASNRDNLSLLHLQKTFRRDLRNAHQLILDHTSSICSLSRSALNCQLALNHKLMAEACHQRRLRRLGSGGFRCNLKAAPSFIRLGHPSIKCCHCVLADTDTAYRINFIWWSACRHNMCVADSSNMEQ